MSVLTYAANKGVVIARVLTMSLAADLLLNVSFDSPILRLKATLPYFFDY
jgi:hypothetical protein